MPSPDTPYRETDDEARAIAQALLLAARFAALAVNHPETGHPYCSRILLAALPGHGPVTLISDLALHSRALAADPRCAVLLGEPKAKGDPLIHPRITIAANAEFLAEPHAMADQFLKRHPKARLYAGFADFRFVRLVAQSAELNAGFGKAYHLTAQDLEV